MIHYVTSRANSRIKLAISLNKTSACRKRQQFLMEGPKFISDHIHGNGLTDFIILSENTSKEAKIVAQAADKRQLRVIEVSSPIFSEISDTGTSQGIIAVCPTPEYAIKDILNGKTILVLDGVSDPGNAGTAIRSAAAFNCSGVIFLKGSVFPFSPKVTRSAAGFNSKIPIYEMDNLSTLKSENSDYHFLGAQANAKSVSDLLETLSGPMCIVIGSEAHGLSEKSKNTITEYVSIPMTKGVESLNAGVSASILLYSLFKKNS